MVAPGKHRLEIFLGFALLVLVCTVCSSKDPEASSRVVAEVMLPATRVAPSSLNVFSTPLAWFGGAVYTVTVEEPEGKVNGVNLRTFVWKGVRGKSGGWRWTRKLVEDRTVDDQYHTGPSIGIDQKGYIHLAYNMHNMPWQYEVSRRPADISTFEFRGMPVTLEELESLKWENRASFPRFGTAAIPGTQITYPAFFNDRTGKLYITYRFATHPRRRWADRGFAGAIATYDADTKRWEGLGGPVFVGPADADLPGGVKSREIAAFAFKEGWSVYLVHLFFDVDNHMHLSWLWRKGGAGEDCGDPSYGFSPDSGRTFLRADGTRYRLPITPEDSGGVFGGGGAQKFYAPTSVCADRLGRPVLLLNPIGLPRILTRFSGASATWSQPERSPRGASVVYADDAGMLWAFATGISVFRKNAKTGSRWERVYRDPAGDFGYPKILAVPRKGLILVYAQSLDGSKVKITAIRTGP
jgi:hypothetical protein